MTIADAGLAYMGRPGGLRSYDLWRLDQINRVVGATADRNAADASTHYKRARCGGLRRKRWRFRSTYLAAIN